MDGSGAGGVGGAGGGASQSGMGPVAGGAEVAGLGGPTGRPARSLGAIRRRTDWRPPGMIFAQVDTEVHSLKAMCVTRRRGIAEFDANLAPCLEAQIVDFTDEIAYNAHDIDDGLKSGMLDPEELATVRLLADAVAEVGQGESVGR